MERTRWLGLLALTAPLSACSGVPTDDDGSGGSPSGGASFGGSPSGGASFGGSPSGGASFGGSPSGGASFGGSPSGGSNGEPVWLGPCTLTDISNDGRTVLAREGIWKESTGWVALPDLPGGEVRNTPRVVSGDGRVVYGSSSSDLGEEIYRWTEEEGLVGLGRLYWSNDDENPYDLPRIRNSIATNLDGSVLVGFDLAFAENVFHWTADTGFSDWPGILDSSGGDGPETLFLSDDGSRLAYQGMQGNFEPDLVFIAEAHPVYSFPTAFSGNGLVVAMSMWHFSGGGTFADCPSGGNNCRVAITGLDYTGVTAVGTQHWAYGEPRIFATFFWSQDHGAEFLSNALARRGVFVDVYPTAEALLSGDGRSVASYGSRTPRSPEDPPREGCFLAHLEELDPSAVETTPVSGSLPPPTAACGNGVLDPGEECDDGNVNGADGCTARCTRAKLGASSFGSCAANEAGDVSCWGALARPFVGAEVGRSWTPVAVPGLGNVAHLANGEDHSCAVLRDGTVECWGRGQLGQLGNGGVLDSATPVPVVGLSDAVQVSVRNAHSCAVVASGEVHCWGANSVYPLAPDDSGDALVPVVVPGLHDVIQVALIEHLCDEPACVNVHELATCALREDSSVWCRGVVPGLDGPMFSREPVFLVDGARQISAGEDHLCVLRDAGNALCWGAFEPAFAYENDATPVTWYPEWDADWRPFTLSFPTNTIALAGGHSIECALTSDGLVYCQGRDDAGSRGRGTRYFEGARVNNLGPVLGITNAVHLAVGQLHVCAALADGAVKCWGADTHGQLGIDHVYRYFPASLSRPMPVVGFP